MLCHYTSRKDRVSLPFCGSILDLIMGHCSLGRTPSGDLTSRKNGGNSALFNISTATQLFPNPVKAEHLDHGGNKMTNSENIFNITQKNGSRSGADPNCLQDNVPGQGRAPLHLHRVQEFLKKIETCDVNSEKLEHNGYLAGSINVRTKLFVLRGTF